VKNSSWLQAAERRACIMPGSGSHFRGGGGAAAAILAHAKGVQLVAVARFHDGKTRLVLST